MDELNKTSIQNELKSHSSRSKEPIINGSNRTNGMKSARVIHGYKKRLQNQIRMSYNALMNRSRSTSVQSNRSDSVSSNPSFITDHKLDDDRKSHHSNSRSPNSRVLKYKRENKLTEVLFI